MLWVKKGLNIKALSTEKARFGRVGKKTFKNSASLPGYGTRKRKKRKRAPVSLGKAFLEEHALFPNEKTCLA